MNRDPGWRSWQNKLTPARIAMLYKYNQYSTRVVVVQNSRLPVIPQRARQHKYKVLVLHVIFLLNLFVGHRDARLY